MIDNLATKQIQYTGRYLVLLPEGQEQASSGIRALTEVTGVGDIDDSAVNNLGVAILTLDADQLRSLNVAVAGDAPILAVEPERIVYALVGNLSEDAANYLQGYKDAVINLVDALTQGGIKSRQELSISAAFVDDDASTWGLKATKVTQSPYSGSGIKVAVLDTGMDLNHPDFAGRIITSQSFISGEEVQDLQGHGTHCIGTCCGPLNPPDPSFPPRRYGIAYNAEIFVGKVLSNQGSGSDGSVLAGIEWAIANGCQIISMSLGSYVPPGTPFSPIYEEVAKRALNQGTLIIAAAGNDSDRPGLIEPVSSPANCPSIMAVAALDAELQVAYFSNGSINPNGGEVNIAGPGVNVDSTWTTDPRAIQPGPLRYRTISGTSMATPHVAGIAALYAEATGKRGAELWSVLEQNAQTLSTIPSGDVGSGLVQAPLTSSCQSL